MKSKHVLQRFFVYFLWCLQVGCFYFRQDYIDFSMAIKCAIGGVAGGYIGSKVLWNVNKKVLEISFIIFLMYAGIKMIMG